MTRNELIRKIISLADVKETDAKVFVEILLNKLSQKLLADESFYLPEIGFFQGKIITGKYSSKIISFSSNGKTFDEVIFPLPAQTYGSVKDIDNLFSISIDKPVIPKKISDLGNVEDLLLALESKKYFEMKADKILSYGETRYLSGEENIAEISETLEPLDTQKTPHYDFPDAKVFTREFSDDEQISWDFGADWKKEFEDELLNVDVEETVDNSKLITKVVEEEEINWDFGRTFIDESDIEWKERDDEIIIETSVNEPEDEIVIETKIDEPLEEITVESPESIGADEEILSKDDDGFQAVPSLTRELKIDLSEFDLDNLASEETAEDVELKLSADKSPEDDFIQVKQNQKTRTILEEIGSLDFEAPAISEQRQTEAPEVTPDAYKEIEKSKEYIPTILQEKPVVIEESKKGIWLWTILSIIIIASISLLIYWKYTSFPEWFSTSKKNEITKTQVTPKVIERDFQVPVTYPYNKKEIPIENQMKEIQQENEPEKPVQQIDNVTNPPPSVDKPETKTVIKEPLNVSKVKDNIYLEGTGYVVQVSSWKAKSKADEEVARLKRKGFDAFITSAEIPGRGIWFRVKVKGFSSLQAAENFASQNK